MLGFFFPPICIQQFQTTNFNGQAAFQVLIYSITALWKFHCVSLHSSVFICSRSADLFLRPNHRQVDIWYNHILVHAILLNFIMVCFAAFSWKYTFYNFIYQNSKRNLSKIFRKYSILKHLSCCVACSVWVWYALADMPLPLGLISLANGWKIWGIHTVW